MVQISLSPDRAARSKVGGLLLLERAAWPGQAHTRITCPPPSLPHLGGPHPLCVCVCVRRANVMLFDNVMTQASLSMPCRAARLKRERVGGGKRWRESLACFHVNKPPGYDRVPHHSHRGSL